MKSYFHQNKSGDTPGLNAPHSQLNRIKRVKYFPSEMGKTNFLSLYVFDTDLLNFFKSFFKGILMLSFVLFTFFNHYFVFC